MNRIAIIPARGGSKRIPSKNIIEFCGKPLIAWTIEAAQKSAMFNRIMVSTDSEEIADVSRDFGVEVPFLRAEACDDYSGASEATIHALTQSCAHWNTQFDEVVQLMPNCPLRDSEDICTAVKQFEKWGANFMISAFEFGWMNPWWATKMDIDGRPEALFPEAMNSRSQDLERLFCPSGAIWMAQCKALTQAATFYGPDHRYHVMPWDKAIDIDDYGDLKMANCLFQMKNNLQP